MPKRPNDLSPAEWTLMQAAWRRGSATVRELLSDVEGETSWAYSTAKTILDRMVTKGLLKVTRVGTVKQYTAVRPRGEFVPEAIDDFFDRVLDGDSCAPIVQYLARKRQLNAAEVEELQRILREGEDS